MAEKGRITEKKGLDGEKDAAGKDGLLYSGRDLRKLILPLVVEQVLSIAVGMADTVMVSAAGEAAVSGVSLVDTVSVLLINVFGALATGGAVAAGHFLGKKNRQEACRTAWQILLFSTLLAFVIAVGFMAAHDSLLRLMFGKIEPDVMQACRTYLLVTAPSFVAVAIYNSCAALFRAINCAGVTMWTSLLMNAINVVGNAVCIFRLKMGVAGVAWPTLVSRYVAALLIFALMFQKKREINLCGQVCLRMDFRLLKRILYIAIPNGVENSMFQLGKILVISAVSTMGTASIAANAVANSVVSWNALPGSAINMALVSVVSVCVGAGEYGQARYYTRKMYGLATIGIGAFSVVLFFACPAIAGFFNLGPEALEMAVQVIRLHTVAAVFLWVPAFTIPNTLRAAGDVVWPMAVAVLSMWLFRVVAAYVFTYAFGFGLLAVWVAMVIDWAFRAVCYLWRYRGHRWEKFGDQI